MAEEAGIDAKNTVESQTTGQESSTTEENNDGVIELGIGNTNTENDTNEETESDSVEDKTETEAKTEESGKASRKNAETRKQQLNNEIRDKVAERNALRAEVAKLEQEKYRLKQASDIPSVQDMTSQINPDTGDYYTKDQAKIARIEAERELEKAQKEMDEYIDNIVDNKIRLSNESHRVLKDFPIFDETSDQYNEPLAKEAERIASSLLITDKDGDIIGSRGSIYDVYAALAKAAMSGQTNGEIAGRRAAQRMMNSADVLGSNSTSADDSDDNDPFIKGFKKAS